MTSPAIFISYRRADCGAAANHLAENLRTAFGPDQVFFDTRSIDPGVEWPEETRLELESAKIVLACIGRRWHLVQDEETGECRLDMEGDWVRRELEWARTKGVKVFPVLLDGREELPRAAIEKRKSLSYLATLQPVVLRHGHERDHGLDRLVAAITALGIAELPQDQQRPADPGDLLARYLAHVRETHSHLVPFFPELEHKLLSTVAVALELRPDRAPERGKLAGHDSGSLGELLLEGGNLGGPGLLLVVGEPGAGKSTIARNLARELAESPGDTTPVPVFVALSRVDPDTFDPFDHAASELRLRSTGETAALAGSLRALAAEGRAVLLFDGLDEVEPAQIDRVAAAIEAFAGASRSPVAVMARPIAVEGRDLDRKFDRASVQRLSPELRSELAARLLGEDVAFFEAELERSPPLADLCRNPLMLTMAAMVALQALRDHRSMPARRGELYDRAIHELLHKGYGKSASKVRDPLTARTLLQALSLDLHEQGGESWDRAALNKTLWRVRRSDEELNFQLKETWEENDKFLDDIGINAGVIGPHDGRLVGWRYLHRSLREYLVAERLAGLGAEEWKARIEEWAKHTESDEEQDRERWGEVFALLCGMVDEPLEVLEAVRGVSEDLVVRALLTVESLPAETGLGFAVGCEGVDGAILLALCRNWGVSAEEAERVLLPHVTGDTSVERAGGIWFALEALGREPDRESFFRACGRPVHDGVEVPWVELPGGPFVMGSPEGEPERIATEGPQHEVTVEQFKLSATAVTNAEYARFDHGYRERTGCAGEKYDRHPAVNLSWWEARLYCAWIGARLPSEAEWEYACRGGRTTPFSFGDNITPAQVNYDGNYPYAGGKKGEYRQQTVPVGSLPANDRGLFEMHGNVDEWCEDEWHDSYEGAPDDGSPWLEDGSGFRVVRGGSWPVNAGDCRSADRFRVRPGLRYDDLGFRPASSSPAALTTSRPPQTPADDA